MKYTSLKIIMPAVSPTIALLGLAFMLVPLAAFWEDSAALVWTDRLYQPSYADEASRHTPRETQGTFLPPTISASITYTAADNPLILARTTTIPPGILVTLAPGTRIVAHEFATLTVHGQLVAAGTKQDPIVFTTNEVHDDNKNWNGLFISDAGHASLTHTRLEYASPAVSCLQNSTLQAANLHTRFGLVGIYATSPACTLVNSRLQALHYGIVARGVKPLITNTLFSTGRAELLTIR